MDGWASAAATRRGTRHARLNEPGQDALCLRHAGRAGGVLVAAVADGAGSAPRGGAGAALSARTAGRTAVEMVDTLAPAKLTEAAMTDCLHAAREAVVSAAVALERPPRDLATTLILVVSDGATTLVGHVGDGAVVVQAGEGWRVLSWPAQGLYAGSTYFLTDETPDIRISRTETPVTAVAAFTDGLERLVLDFAAEAPHSAFFARMTAPVARLQRPGRDAALSLALGRYLDGDSVCSRTDDDKTLLLAVRLSGAGA